MSSKQSRNFLFYILLFWDFFSVSAFTLGGGYVMIVVMQQVFVQKKKLINIDRFTQLLASAQLLPGPIALTSSIFLGNEIAGTSGAFIGIVGTTLPPFFAIYLVYLFMSILDSNLVDLFMIGVKAATIAAITQFLLKIVNLKRYDLFSLFILILFTLIGLIYNFSPILLLLIGAIVFFIYNYIKTSYL